MLKIRLQRIGRKNDPSYRVVVVDSRQGPRAGRYIDLVGTHNPKQGVSAIDGEKVRKWIANGAQVSPTVHNMLIEKKIIEGKKINVLPKKTPIVAETPSPETTEAPATETRAEETSEEPAPESAPAENDPAQTSASQ